MLPLSYAWRNLARTPSRTLHLILGSGLVVALVLAAGAFHAGMSASLEGTADPALALVLGVGSEESIERSSVPANAAGIVTASLACVQQELGQAAVAGEVVHMAYLEVAKTPCQGTLRGVVPTSLAVHRTVRLLDGRFPIGDEVLVGRRAHQVLGVAAKELATNETISCDGRRMIISGHFAAGGGVLEGECWMPLAAVQSLARREDLSCVYVRLTDPTRHGDLALFCAQRLDLGLTSVSELEYYRRLGDFFAPLRLVVWLSALLIAGGALFGGLNTVYAALSGRIAELAALQAIGFSRPALLTNMVVETILAALSGAVLATLATLPVLDRIEVGISAGVVALTVTPTVLAWGLAAGLILGLVGALPPALRCLAPPVALALRS